MKYMEQIFLLFFISLVSSIFCQTPKMMNDPIPGVEVKLGRKPPGAGRIIATGTTDARGQLEFKNLPEGTGYYLEFGIREKGIKSKRKSHTMIIGLACTAGSDRSALPSADTEKWDDYIITVTVTGNNMAVNLNTSRSN